MNNLNQNKDRINKIINLYDNILNSNCTFCGETITQRLWIPHYEICLSMAKKLQITENKTKITTLTSTTPISNINKKNKSIQNKAIQHPQSISNELALFRHEVIILDSDSKDEKEEEKQKQIEDKQPERKIFEEYTTKSLIFKESVNNKNDGQLNEFLFCSFRNCSLFDKTQIESIVITIGNTEINVCRLNHFFEKQFVKEFLRVYSSCDGPISPNVKLEAKCNGQSCDQKRKTKRTTNQFDCTKFIRFTTRKSMVELFYCSIECLVESCSNKNSNLSNTLIMMEKLLPPIPQIN